MLSSTKPVYDASAEASSAIHASNKGHVMYGAVSPQCELGGNLAPTRDTITDGKHQGSMLPC